MVLIHDMEEVQKQKDEGNTEAEDRNESGETDSMEVTRASADDTDEAHETESLESSQ